MREINDGQTVVSNKKLCGKTFSATNDEDVKNVAKLFEADRRFICDEIAYELDISNGSAYRILSERLQMRKIAARWVPHMLSEMKRKRHRVKISRSHLQRYAEKGDEMLQRIIAIDETWVRSFEPELKRQSSEWHTKNRRSQKCPKMRMMILAYDYRGVLTSHRVPTGETVNKE